MIDWQLKGRRIIRAWSRAWHLHDPLAWVLNGVVGLFSVLIPCIICYLFDIWNSIFLLMFLFFFVGFYMMVKTSDYFDMHGM